MSRYAQFWVAFFALSGIVPLVGKIIDDLLQARDIKRWNAEMAKRTAEWREEMDSE